MKEIKFNRIVILNSKEEVFHTLQIWHIGNSNTGLIIVKSKTDSVELPFIRYKCLIPIRKSSKNVIKLCYNNFMCYMLKYMIK